MLPALGGQERRVASYAGGVGSIAWSPNGKSIAAGIPHPGEGRSLYLIAVESGEQTRVTTPPPDAQDVNPRFSPDGTALGFIRVTSTFSNTPYWIRIGEAANARQIGEGKWSTQSLEWFPDGKAILIPVKSGADTQYWKLALAGGPPVQLPLVFQPTFGVPLQSEISLRGDRLAAGLDQTIIQSGRLVWNESRARWEPADF